MKVVDYSNLPDRSYQLRWLRFYLESYFDIQGRIGVKVSDDEVEKLYDQVNKFSLVRSSTHLHPTCRLPRLEAVYSQFDF